MISRCSVVSILCLLLPFSGPARAHEIQPAIASLVFQPQGDYRLRIRLNLELLIAGVDPQHADTDESAQAEEYERLRRMSPPLLSDAFGEFADALLAGITVRDSSGRRLAHEVTALDIPEVGNTELARA